MKHALAALSIALVLILSVTACKKGGAKPGAMSDAMVLAKIGKTEITAGQVNSILDKEKVNMTQQGQPVNDDMMNMMRKRVLDFLVENEIIIQEAGKQGITVTDEDVNKLYNDELQRIGGQEKLNQMLQERGMTADVLRDRIRQFLLRRKLQDKVTEIRECPAS